MRGLRSIGRFVLCACSLAVALLVGVAELLFGTSGRLTTFLARPFVLAHEEEERELARRRR